MPAAARMEAMMVNCIFAVGVGGVGFGVLK